MAKKTDKKKKRKSGGEGEFRGRLDVTRSGMGYVITDKLDTDIMVRPNDFNTALHGDMVKVSVTGDQQKSGRKQGRVTEVLDRKQTEFLGRIEVSPGFAFFIAETDKPMPDIYIPLDKLNGAVHGDKVIVKLLSWEKNKKPGGAVLEVLDAGNANDAAMKELIMENGFSISFPEEVLEAAERLPEALSPEEIARRKDCREVLTFTIDPADAKDFDDAISFRVLRDGNYEIGVHIADVSYYVEPESELDETAYERATSVYLPDRVNPMLPERISNELCSLRPDEDKLTFAVIFEITPKAEIKSHWIGRTVIHSNKRFAYGDVQALIENGPGELKDEILILNNLAQRFRKQRFKKGAINFSSQEVKFKLDENGKPIGIEVKESKESHQLIEEFMLLANKTVAAYAASFKVNKKAIPFPYRIHDAPDQEKLLPFIEFAKKYGHKFDTKTPEGIAASFNEMLEATAGKPEQHVLQQLGIRTMAKAIYTSENIGHYGLGFENYTHFTSPIRRYPDVMVHRIVAQLLDQQLPIDKKMEAKCRHCSERERAAMDTERAANKYKQVEFMQDKIGEEFDGIISGVSSFGFWVETVEYKCEGLVSINGLFDFDDFRYVESDYCLVGRRSGKIFRMGDKLRIRLVSANLAKRQLDYEWIIKSAEPIQETGETEYREKKKKSSKD